jgi:hypothetical protein
MAHHLTQNWRVRFSEYGALSYARKPAYRAESFRDDGDAAPDTSENWPIGIERRLRRAVPLLVSMCWRLRVKCILHSDLASTIANWPMLNSR